MALRSDMLKQVISDEMCVIENNTTWEQVKLPKGKNHLIVI